MLCENDYQQHISLNIVQDSLGFIIFLFSEWLILSSLIVGT